MSFRHLHVPTSHLASWCPLPTLGPDPRLTPIPLQSEGLYAMAHLVNPGPTHVSGPAWEPQAQGSACPGPRVPAQHLFSACHLLLLCVESQVWYSESAIPHSPFVGCRKRLHNGLETGTSSAGGRCCNCPELTRASPVQHLYL